MNVPYNKANGTESSTSALAETRCVRLCSSLLSSMITLCTDVNYVRSGPIFRKQMPVSFTTISFGEKSDTYNVYGDLNLRRTCEGGKL